MPVRTAGASTTATTATTATTTIRRAARTLAAGLGVALTAGLTLVPLTASAAGPVAARCGAVLTRDAYLTKDLVCTGDALTLSGGITLDLRGHTLVARNGTAVTVTGDGNPTIRRGSIVDSDTGVNFTTPEAEDQPRTRKVQISKVTFKRNIRAVNTSATDFYTYFTTLVTITDSHFHRNRLAIYGVSTGLITVSGSSFTNNTIGITVDIGAADVSRSYFGNNGRAVTCSDADCSLTDSRLENNPEGVAVTGGLELRRTTITWSTTAVSAFVVTGVLDRNTFADNTVGVDLKVTEATVTRNVFLRNATGLTATLQSQDRVVNLVGNTFRDGGDGVRVDEPGVALRDNRATGNTGVGFYVPTGVDLGGNTASGNGADPQCVGVVC